VNQKILSRDETGIVKILFALMEGFDTVKRISDVTNLKKSRKTIIVCFEICGVCILNAWTKKMEIKREC